jgi:hypothetical protein
MGLLVTGSFRWGGCGEGLLFDLRERKSARKAQITLKSASPFL